MNCSKQDNYINMKAEFSRMNSLLKKTCEQKYMKKLIQLKYDDFTLKNYRKLTFSIALDITVTLINQNEQEFTKLNAYYKKNLVNFLDYSSATWDLKPFIYLINEMYNYYACMPCIEPQNFAENILQPAVKKMKTLYFLSAIITSKASKESNFELLMHDYIQYFEYENTDIYYKVLLANAAKLTRTSTSIIEQQCLENDIITCHNACQLAM